MELLKYKHNIVKPALVINYHEVRKQDNYSVIDHIEYQLKLGTYWKPIAKIIRFILKRHGWSVKLRGRGIRSSKRHNFNKDIAMRDSVFCAVYAWKNNELYSGLKLF